VQREGDRLRFEVRDTGQGLTPEQQAHLFEPFNRLGREQGSEAGTGIGLVITQRLVSMMGGELQVACVAGEGCRFWFALPGTEAAEPAAVQLPSGNG
jgi:signal transduction histidine kinase